MLDWGLLTGEKVSMFWKKISGQEGRMGLLFAAHHPLQSVDSEMLALVLGQTRSIGAPCPGKVD